MGKVELDLTKLYAVNVNLNKVNDLRVRDAAIREHAQWQPVKNPAPATFEFVPKVGHTLTWIVPRTISMVLNILT